MAIELTTATNEQLSGIRQALGGITLRELFPHPDTIFGYASGGDYIIAISAPIIDFKNFDSFKIFTISEKSVTTILNANVLTNLENQGTLTALNLINNLLSESALNQLFTDLPETTKTVTINVAGNPGAATCDTSIATEKGYTVVTSL